MNDSTTGRGVGATERRLIEQLVDRLVDRFPGLDPVTVRWVVGEIHARYDGRPVREYIPLFVERHAFAELERLSATAETRAATA
ncbi:hypothetical protein BST36_00410 [Mycolicibacterium moriokaense]|uniref:DUF3562 domain-containing protein n=1 Tax=Mycolicibacterium moriokaense TaxID=39691 RepID=A0AAD1H968_9MYCO|nr:hypothetical protein [Mycolicibacterium moriokaense]MCV7041216.1 hypothetical protein [Mycolicibacterium moriokaense]ORB27181.1 hypothetical protein BST36_00410 [Mycolicibacterium moriokaense]BBX00779.1 hypothetical protein MMOR_17150 [Mycolicibacterium moriokaense]